MNNTREYAQGARCGHIEGKGRAGQYCVGEEFDPGYDAAVASGFAGEKRLDWFAGYRFGYKRAAEGSALPAGLVNAPLPEVSTYGQQYVGEREHGGF
jgi:hypothetical protein